MAGSWLVSGSLRIIASHRILDGFWNPRRVRCVEWITLQKCPPRHVPEWSYDVMAKSQSSFMAHLQRATRNQYGTSYTYNYKVFIPRQDSRKVRFLLLHQDR
jgi:hypothetical protein